MGLAFDGSNLQLTRPVTAFTNGWAAYSVCAWIKSNVTNVDTGWFNLNAPNGADDFGAVRYDAGGASGGGTNLMKFGLTVSSGVIQAESANNTQTTDLQFVIGRWQDGSQAEIVIDGVETAYTFQSGVGTGTVNDTVNNQITLGKGPKETGATSWNGEIYEIRVYERYITDAEAESMFTLRGADRDYDNIRLWYREAGLSPGVTLPTTADFFKDVTLDANHLTANASGIVATEQPLKYQAQVS